MWLLIHAEIKVNPRQQNAPPLEFEMLLMICLDNIAFIAISAYIYANGQ